MYERTYNPNTERKEQTERRQQKNDVYCQRNQAPPRGDRKGSLNRVLGSFQNKSNYVSNASSRQLEIKPKHSKPNQTKSEVHSHGDRKSNLIIPNKIRPSLECLLTAIEKVLETRPDIKSSSQRKSVPTVLLARPAMTWHHVAWRGRYIRSERRRA